MDGCYWYVCSTRSVRVMAVIAQGLGCNSFLMYDLAETHATPRALGHDWTERAINYKGHLGHSVSEGASKQPSITQSLSRFASKREEWLKNKRTRLKANFGHNRLARERTNAVCIYLSSNLLDPNVIHHITRQCTLHTEFVCRMLWLLIRLPPLIW